MINSASQTRVWYFHCDDTGEFHVDGPGREISALAHNPGMKARVLTGARPPIGHWTIQLMEKTQSLTLASQQVAETDGLTQDFSVSVWSWW